MNRSPDPSRLYDDREIGALIQRATELQESRDSRNPGSGLPLREIERIGAEIGISPADLRAAAMDLEASGSASKGQSLVGGPFEVVSRSHLSIVIGDEEWARIVAELRRMTGSPGRVEMVAGRLEWTRTVSDLGQVMESTQVTLTPGEDGTIVDLRTRFGGGARFAYVVSVLLGGGVAGIFLDGAAAGQLLSTLAVGGGVAGGLATGRLSVGLWARRRRKELKTLAAWLQGEIDPEVPEPQRTQEEPVAR